LHSYVITDAIRDEKVLKFKVDYNDVRPQFKSIETEIDEKKLSAAENKKRCFIRNASKKYLNTFYRILGLKRTEPREAAKASMPCLP
jgi:type I restriction enzyme R subunit